MSETIAIGIDLGGTNLKVAAVDRDGNILDQRSEPTDPTAGPDACIAQMAKLADAALSQLDISSDDLVGAGLGCPGPLDLRSGSIIRSANLPGWVDVPVRDMLSKALATPVVLDNDANAAAFGEYWAGAGKDGGDLVMLTLGTGLGGGVILDGRLLHGHFGSAAEIGHMIVVAGGLCCPCGQHGCVEQYASASAVAVRVVAAIKTGEPSSLSASMTSITAERVVEHARSGDALCRRVWDEACLYLAITCVNLQHLHNPARIILGGGMAQAGAFLFDRVKEYVGQQTWKLCEDVPEITPATLGYDAGVIGAAGLAWENHASVGAGKSVAGLPSA